MNVSALEYLDHRGEIDALSDARSIRRNFARHQRYIQHRAARVPLLATAMRSRYALPEYMTPPGPHLQCHIDGLKLLRHSAISLSEPEASQMSKARLEPSVLTLVTSISTLQSAQKREGRVFATTQIHAYKVSAQEAISRLTTHEHARVRTYRPRAVSYNSDTNFQGFCGLRPPSPKK